MYGFSAMKTSLAVVSVIALAEAYYSNFVQPLVGSAIFAGGVTSVMVSRQETEYLHVPC